MFLWVVYHMLKATVLPVFFSPVIGYFEAPGAFCIQSVNWSWEHVAPKTPIGASLWGLGNCPKSSRVGLFGNTDIALKFGVWRWSDSPMRCPRSSIVTGMLIMSSVSNAVLSSTVEILGRTCCLNRLYGLVPWGIPWVTHLKIITSPMIGIMLFLMGEVRFMGGSGFGSWSYIKPW